MWWESSKATVIDLTTRIEFVEMIINRCSQKALCFNRASYYCMDIHYFYTHRSNAHWDAQDSDVLNHILSPHKLLEPGNDMLFSNNTYDSQTVVASYTHTLTHTHIYIYIHSICYVGRLRNKLNLECIVLNIGGFCLRCDYFCKWLN